MSKKNKRNKKSIMSKLVTRSSREGFAWLSPIESKDDPKKSFIRTIRIKVLNPFTRQ